MDTITSFKDSNFIMTKKWSLVKHTSDLKKSFTTSLKTGRILSVFSLVFSYPVFGFLGNFRGVSLLGIFPAVTRRPRISSFAPGTISLELAQISRVTNHLSAMC